MSFSRVKSLGWAFLEILTSGQMTQLDADHANAVDGAAGGTYAGPLTLTNIVQAVMAQASVGGTNSVDLAGRSVARYIPGHGYPDNPASWVRGAGYYQTAVNTAATMSWRFQLPKGYTITAFSIRAVGKAGHVGLPASMPALSLSAMQDPAFGGATSVGTANDTSASTAAYEASHVISVSGLSYTALDPSAGWFEFIFASESGANALDTLKVSQPKITFTASRLDEF